MLRRTFLWGVGALLSGYAAPPQAAGSNLVFPSTSCRTTRRLVQGPYYTPTSPLRSDIREDRAGVPLRLDINVLNDFNCGPLPDAVIDIWQCDANGLYSGVENLSFDVRTLQINGMQASFLDRTFLRGHQITDQNGRATFITILPGWYVPRLAHIHVRVLSKGVEWTGLVTQLFFDPQLEREIYATGAYALRGQNPIDARRDPIVKGDRSILRDLTIPLRRDGEGLRGEFTIASIAV